jgi:hypothetical protein
MKEGALAMLDALGFKGIWRRGYDEATHTERAEKVVVKLRRAIALVEEEVARIKTYDAEHGAFFEDVIVTVLSDTIVFGVAKRLPADPAVWQGTINREAMCVGVAATLVQKILAEAALTDPPIAYRGCISYGQFMIDREFVVGPAVDEVAELEKRAQGAFVWLAPKAHRTLRHRITGEPHYGYPIVPYDVPIRDGGFYRTGVIAPFPSRGESFGEEELRKHEMIYWKLLGSFGSDAPFDVEIKEQNTRLFLDYAGEKIITREAAKKMWADREARFQRNIAEAKEREAQAKRDGPPDPE